MQDFHTTDRLGDNTQFKSKQKQINSYCLVFRTERNFSVSSPVTTMKQWLVNASAEPLMLSHVYRLRRNNFF